MIAAILAHRKEGAAAWAETPMQVVEGDHWRGEFTAGKPGAYEYAIEGWVDHFLTWRRDLTRWVEAGQDVSGELQLGARLVDAAASRANGADATRLEAIASDILERAAGGGSTDLALSDELATLMSRYPDRRYATRCPELPLTVDPPKAVYSSWYEAFPRSFGTESGRHGTFRECETTLLPYVAEMGFDVLYLPPIHPIGHTNRKGKNNALVAAADDPGSPWGIGSR